ncbi:hypothetical protein HOY80DRAFT_1136262 [Tuber brumale]|nr:hypothetical protein HOY80DRAFT_1136262 [Tuber brumale]
MEPRPWLLEHPRCRLQGRHWALPGAGGFYQPPPGLAKPLPLSADSRLVFRTMVHTGRAGLLVTGVLVLSGVGATQPRAAFPRTLSGSGGDGQRGRTLTRQPPSSKATGKLNARSTDLSTGIIVAGESDLSLDEDQSLLVLPPHVRHISINTKVTHLGHQLQDAHQGDRSSKDVSKWCTELINESTLATQFIPKHHLYTRSIRAPERLKFANACVNCLHLGCGNLPTFAVATAMWRVLRALVLNLESQKIAIQIEKQLMNVRFL